MTLNRRAIVLAGLAAIPAALGATPLLAAPKSGGRGRKPAGRTRKPSGQKQPGRTAARPKFKVVTRTFASSVPITIPLRGSASPYAAAIGVGGLPGGTIQKVVLTLSGFTHPYPGDVDIMLVAPNGRGVVVLSDAGGDAVPSSATGLTVVFDDQASSGVPTPLVSGIYKPTNGSGDPFPAPAPPGQVLAELNGGNPNGLWKLYVVDDFSEDGGSIAGWALRIRAQIKVAQKPKPKGNAKPKGSAKPQAKATRGQARRSAMANRVQRRAKRR